MRDRAYSKAKACAAEEGTLTVSGLQRHLGIGYTAAGELMNRMIADGLMEPLTGAWVWVGKPPRKRAATITQDIAAKEPVKIMTGALRGSPAIYESIHRLKNPVNPAIIDPSKQDNLNKDNAAIKAEEELDILPGNDFEQTQARATVELARAAKLTFDDAYAIVTATISKPDEMKAASQKTLKPKKRFISKSDLTDAELNDPAVIQPYRDFASKHQNTDISELDPDTAYKLRKARLITKYDLDRRQKGRAPSP